MRLSLLTSGKAKAKEPLQNQQGFELICKRFDSFNLQGPNSLKFDKDGKQTKSLHLLSSAQIESRLDCNTSTQPAQRGGSEDDKP